jgi:hypothetical protein
MKKRTSDNSSSSLESTTTTPNEEGAILYVITLDGKPLEPDVWRKYSKTYGTQGATGLYGWRPPKKVYYTLGRARCGLHHVPRAIRSKCRISAFTWKCDIDLDNKTQGR